MVINRKSIRSSDSRVRKRQMEITRKEKAFLNKNPQKDIADRRTKMLIGKVRAGDMREKKRQMIITKRQRAASRG